MQSPASGSICWTCVSKILLRPSISPFPRAQPCLDRRFLSQRRAGAKPSRMVLANRVDRTPGKTTTRKGPGPFGSMNRRTANVDPARLKPAATETTTESTSRDRRRAFGRGEKVDDRKALKMQQTLSGVPQGRRNVLKDRMAPWESFPTFDLLPCVQRALREDVFKGMVDVKPTPVQRLAIPALLEQKRSLTPPETDELSEEAETKIVEQMKAVSKESGEMKSFLLAAETGSGKTLAYLLPAINALKIAELQDTEIAAYEKRAKEEKAKIAERLERLGPWAGKKVKEFSEPHPTMARPKAIVLVPTAELARQVRSVAKRLSFHVRFKTEMLSSDLRPQQIQRNIYATSGIDLVVSTPHLLSSMAESNPNILSRVTHLVIDEADSLFDRSFAPVTTSIVERAMPSLRHLVCCSATIPRKLNNYLATNYPKMNRITTPNLHAIPRRVQLGVIDVSKDPYRNNKDLACADIIYSIGREASRHEGPVKGEVDVRRIIVFVNEREKTEEVAEFLRTKGIDAQALHRDTPEKHHGEILGTFTTSDPLRVDKQAGPQGGRQRSGALPNVKVLVVTDLASRGIDTLAVRFVVLYDVPHTTIDFIHRLGRAGRMGRRGRGIVLAGNDDRKDVIAEVKRSMFMGQALI